MRYRVGIGDVVPIFMDREPPTTLGRVQLPAVSLGRVQRVPPTVTTEAIRAPAVVLARPVATSEIARAPALVAPVARPAPVAAVERPLLSSASAPPRFVSGSAVVKPPAFTLPTEAAPTWKPSKFAAGDGPSSSSSSEPEESPSPILPALEKGAALTTTTTPVSASIDIPVKLWVGLAVLGAATVLGGVYLLTRQPKAA
jgi:hypothetical protein